MPNFNFVLLYVANPPASAKFYADLLGRPPVDVSPGFAMLPLTDGVMLGLWKRDAVLPKVTAEAGAGEVAFTVSSNEEVDRTHADWKTRRLTIAQSPAAMDFGYTFTALDPDGHRLRVFAPSA